MFSLVGHHYAVDQSLRLVDVETTHIGLNNIFIKGVAIPVETQDDLEFIFQNYSSAPRKRSDKELRLFTHGIGFLQFSHFFAEQAFLRLRAVDPDACLNMLCALDGAVAGIRWHDLPTGRKTELKEFHQMLQKS